MANRNIVRILPNGSAWKVTYNSVLQKNFNVKIDAIEYGRKLAKANEPSQLIISKTDGTIETEYTYGNDPYPPRG